MPERMGTMAKIRLHHQENMDQTGAPMELDYYLLSELVQDMALYGVEIELRRGGQMQCESCARVTPLESRMTALIASLAAHTVTPVTLRERLMDLL